MKSRRTLLLGSTGSIGRQALEVISSLNFIKPSTQPRFEVVGLAAGRNLKLLQAQIQEHRPNWVSIQDERDLETLKALSRNLKQKPHILAGATAIQELLRECESDLVINGLVGAAGLLPTLTALDLGLDVALANKESLVIGGSLIQQSLQAHNGRLIPIDSEHSAIFQLLENQENREISRVILTASGGALRDLPLERLASVTPGDVLRHPTWQMGERITIDSATLVNKAFEVIEAHWLFNLAWEQIDVVMHPESIIHGLIEFSDGSLWAQMGAPDMRIPIQYALTYPERQPGPFERLDLRNLSLNFKLLDKRRYPAFEVVLEAGRMGGTAPAVVNAADEVAVERFLKGEIPFTEIPKILAEVLAKHIIIKEPSLEDILEADRWARSAGREAE